MEQALQNCPLDPNTFLQWPKPMGYHHLQAITDHVSTGDCPLPHPPLNELVFGGPVMGTTPLLLAFNYGEFDSAKYIVESWGVDVRTPATYYIDPFISDLKIETAQPLFVAASLGHSKIVRFLLEKGVDVNAKTLSEADIRFDGLTPLYGAVCDFWKSSNQPLDEQRAERNSIVLSLLQSGANPSASGVPQNACPIWMNGLCSVDTTMALIDHGMDLNLRCHSRGATVLHHWASLPPDFTEENSLAIVRLLLRKCADVMAKDDYGLTPILIAAGACSERPNLTVLDFLLKRDNISTIEKIEAMEMAGARILCDPRNAPIFQKAFDYWIRATDLRQKKMKRWYPYRKKLEQNSGGPVEWITWDQLERGMHHPSEYVVQSFLIQLRISSSRSCAAVESFLAHYFRGHTFETMWDEGNFVDLFYILGATLDTYIDFFNSDKSIWPNVVRVVFTIVQILWNLVRSNSTFFNSEVIQRSLLLILKTDDFRLSVDDRDEVIETRYTNALSSFLKLLLRHPETLKEKWEWLHRLFRQWGPHQLGSILLEICKDWEESKRNHEDYLNIIRLLLKLGAVPDAIDQDDNGPLHVVARTNNQQSEAAGCLLLGFGANLHRRNSAGKTAMDLWIERNEDEDDEEAARLRHRPDWCHAVPKLQCLSARCVRAYRVPHSKMTVFHRLIENH